ncbi:hypothetical protein WICMUC_005898 [Wickerhamomyces mucosus]|uniref:Diacylglycerol O-acyltransferase n=1 Tax=Wickerhamomyces mucosus TaxID=1378264 RepID=A0A9P8P150_9ASCO|nr:hypothetical protein WICMUC_005898 [Wickerhamomyces mucosus]
MPSKIPYEEINKEINIESSLNGTLKNRKPYHYESNNKEIRHKINSQFAPLNTPFKRRLQTLAVAWHTVSIASFLSFFLFVLGIPPLWPLVFIYIIYFLFDKTPLNGGVTERYSTNVRQLSIWKYFCDFFPIKLHKTTDLEPTFTIDISNKSKNKSLISKILASLFENKKKFQKTGPTYIFGLHPHGVISLSGFGAFATDGCGWSKNFEGIPVCLLTLINQFFIPFYRDYLMSMGITSSGRTNALKILRKGYSIAIVIGGAREALLAKPDSNDIVLNKRKGFIKLAMETGNVGLVPCFCFGENDLYQIFEIPDNSYGKKFQLWLKKTVGFTIPFFHARGIFNYDFGLIPYRKDVNIVVGEPIIVPFLPSPKKHEVDHYHSLYIEGLKKLFEENKSKFLNSSGEEYKLAIVE